MQWIFGAFAVALEMCKYAFFPIGWWLWRQSKKAAGGVFVLMGFSLVLVSVGASVSFMEGGTRSGEQVQLQASESYQALSRKLYRLEARMDTRNALAAKGLDGYMITVGTDNLNNADSLESQWQLIFQERQQLEPQQVEGVSVFFSLLADRLGVPEAGVRFWCFVSLAVFVEVCAVALLWWLSLPPAPLKETSSASAAVEHSHCATGAHRREPLPSIEQQAQQPLPTVADESRLSEKAQKVVAAIRNGGEPIVNRFTQGEPPIRHNHVKAAFSFLEACGEIEREGQGYRHVSAM